MVVELKVKPFEPEFAGKLNFYVNAVDNLLKMETDNPTIGLLICSDMDRTDVQWALQGITIPIGVATYSNVKIEEIQKELPTTEEVRTIVQQVKQEYFLKKDNKQG